MKRQFSTVCHWVAVALTLSTNLHAQGPGSGNGRGQGPGGGGGFQEAIHKLFDNHKKIRRTVELTESGYRSVTVSDDKEVAKTLQKHVKEMRDRLGAGMMIRRWDPAFAELVEHYSDIEHEFKEIDGGVELVAKGKTPEAVKVVKNHAAIVSGFVEKGGTEMHAAHPRALEQAKQAAAPKDCNECKEDATKAPLVKDCPACGKEAAKAPTAVECPSCKAGENKTPAAKSCPDCKSDKAQRGPEAAGKPPKSE